MLEKIVRRYGISANIILLGVVSFLTDTSSEMIRPLLPLFIVYLGGTYQAIGLIGGVGDSAASILKVISGYLSDKTGKRKIFVFAGYLTSAIAKTLYAFAATWQHILLLKTGERTGKGLRAAPRDAIIANSTHHDKRGLAFGVHRAMDSGGAIAGSMLAIIILSYFWFFELEFGLMYQYAFIIAGIIAFFALVPLHGVREDDATHNRQSIRASFSALPRSFRIYVAIATIFALGNFTYMFFILRAGEFLLAENGMSVVDVGRIAEIDPKFVLVVLILISALHMLFNITYTIGRRNVLIIGYSLFGVTCIGFAMLQSVAAFVILFALYGGFKALVDGTQRAYASDFVGPELRGTALGVFHTLTGIAALPASIIAGILGGYAPSATFLYGAAIGFLAAGLFVIAGRKGV